MQPALIMQVSLFFNVLQKAFDSVLQVIPHIIFAKKEEAGSVEKKGRG